MKTWGTGNLFRNVLLIAGMGVMLAGIALPFDSLGADKLVVKDTGGNTKFVATDEVKVGIGTATPLSPLHVLDVTTSGSRGMMSTQHNAGPQAAVIVLRKSRGTEAAPAGLQNGDYIGTIHAQGHDGTSYLSNISTGSLAFFVDGSVTTGVIPTGLSFMTGSTEANKSERLRIGSNGNIGIGTAVPTQLLDINGNGIRIEQPRTPASAGAACNQGDMAWDASYVYVCVAQNAWKRASLAAW